MISEALGFEARIEEAAHLVARLEGKVLVDTATQAAPFADKPEQVRAAKSALLNVLCLALLAPRGKFNVAAEDLKWDFEGLARRFSIPQGKVMMRLAILHDGIAALSVDATGRVRSSAGKLPFHLAKDEPLCAQLPLFDEGFGVRVATLQSANGSHFAAIALREQGHASALFMSAQVFEKTNYGLKAIQRPIGATCRLCEIRNCEKRSAASAVRPAGLNDYTRGATDFEPV